MKYSTKSVDQDKQLLLFVAVVVTAAKAINEPGSRLGRHGGLIHGRAKKGSRLKKIIFTYLTVDSKNQQHI